MWESAVVARSFSRRWWRVLAGLAALVLGIVQLVVGVAPPAAAFDPCGPDESKIACENAKPGAPQSEWDISGAGDNGIQGYATQMSVNVGDTVDFKIDTPASDYTITIYRTGWYGGLGARKIAEVEPSATLPQIQPECVHDLTTDLYDCGAWAVSASWAVPEDAVSGVYIAHLERPENNDESHITFVVRDDASTSDIVFQTSDTTWQAYNTYGGVSLYQGSLGGRSHKVSYNRPFATRGHEGGRDFYFSSEYAMVRFLERNGYDVSYVTGIDTEIRGELLTNHKAFLSVGHDEYWSGQQRANVEAARDAGVHLGFFSGNEVYWRTRWEDSALSAPADHRTLVAYKETRNNRKIDPSTEWTGTWRDPRFASAENGGGLPENALTGTAFMSNFSDLPVTVSAEEGKYRLWRHTPLASLEPGTSADLAPHTVGYESNEDLDNGFRPAGLVHLSTTVGAVPQYLQDFGLAVAPGTTEHHTTMYRAQSGALVFSSGSIQWAWGLDQEHDGDGAPADSRMQQATVNILADMDSQPTTLQADLVAATKSTDTAGPTAVIDSPSAAQAIVNGSSVTATGTAQDVGGGHVASVEVSTDGGTTWYRAEGTTSWSYSYIQAGHGTAPLLVRGVDDGANIGEAVGVDVEVACPCSIFGETVPQTPSSTDTSPVELGLRFTPEQDGFATGVRFYKGPGSTGMHTGTLWSSDGVGIASVVFTNETETGWQTASFAAPVPLSANSTYVVSYTAPAGGYAVEAGAFWYRGISSPPLNVAGGFGAEPAGVFQSPGRFPTRSFGASHYFVDVVFSTVDETPLTLHGHSPVDGATSVPTTSAVSTTFSKPIDESTVTFALAPEGGSPVAGATAYDATTRTVTFTPSEPLIAATTYRATVGALDPLGVAIDGTPSWSFTTAAPDRPAGECPCSLFTDSTAPSTLEAADSRAVTLGVRFASDEDGAITALRFYKAPGNAGPHVGTLWSIDGVPLATGELSEESSQGWQTLTFDEPVEIDRDTEYVASYRATIGSYSHTTGAFRNAYQRGPLRVPANGAQFTYADGYPDRSSSTNYLVDVVFDRGPAPLTMVGQTPPPGSVGAPVDSVISATYSKELVDGVQVAVTANGIVVGGTTTLSTERTTVTFAPAATLQPGITHVVTIEGAVAADGTTLPSTSWTFTTSGTDGCPCTLFGNETPATASATDTRAVELGVSFVPSASGTVTAVRFYKGTANTGAHTGTLWSATGDPLATAQFVGESEQGWQTAQLDQPVEVDAGSEYVVSYLAPQGGYAATRNYFTSDHSAWPLTVPAAGNGRYRYGGGFPTSTTGASNYFVDVLFSPGPVTPPTATTRLPSDGAIDVSVSTSVSATLSKPASGDVTVELTGPSGAVAGSTTYDVATRSVRFQPTSVLPYDATITAQLSVDGVALGDGTWSFQTRAAPTDGCPCTLWTDTDVPAHVSWNDSAAVQVGVRFTVADPGTITGIRFYKGLANVGDHVVNLWAADGTLLGTAMSTGETASGWQEVELAAPVAVVPGQVYTAAYHTTSGRYSITSKGLASVRTRGPLSTLVNGGAYVYGTGFPAGSSATNYWVDPVFVPTGA